MFDTKTDKYVSRIPGFVGVAKTGNTSGPNGIVVVNGGAEVWVSDGDSSITIIDTKSGAPTGKIATGGKARANGMAFDPNTKTVIVANSNDDPPFLSLISTEPGHKIIASIPVPDSAENLERSAYHAPSGTFYTVIPVSRTDKTKGLLAQTDPKTGKLVQLHEIERCHPHSLSIVTDHTLFMGCSNGHGPSPAGIWRSSTSRPARLSPWPRAWRQRRLDRQPHARPVLPCHDQRDDRCGRHQVPKAGADGADFDRGALARLEFGHRARLPCDNRQQWSVRRLYPGLRAGIGRLNHANKNAASRRRFAFM